MRQDTRREPHRDPFGTLCQEQWELGRERYRLLVPAVVRGFPLGGLGVKQHLEGKRGKPSLDIAGCGSSVAGKNISPVPLAVNQQLFLSDLYQRVAEIGRASC